MVVASLGFRIIFLHVRLKFIEVLNSPKRLSR